MVNEFLSDWLNEAVKQRGWTFAELARQAGVSTATLSLIVSGDRRLGPAVAWKLGEALGIDPAQLLRLAGQLPDVTPDRAKLDELLFLLSRLTPHQTDCLWTVLRALAQSGEYRPETQFDADWLTLARHIEATLSTEELERLVQHFQQERGERDRLREGAHIRK